jgi:hypothetical protein
MTRFGITLATVLVAGACTGGVDTTDNTPPAGSTSGGSDTTFDHDNSQISPWDLLDRILAEGPPRFTAHVHSCAKPRYATLGNILASRGVNIKNTAQLSAGQLYQDGFNAFGGDNYANRIRENIGITTSGASREFDIFAAAADEIVAAMPTLPACTVGGVGAVMFNASNQCDATGIQCLLGYTPDGTNFARYLDFCNLTVTSASDVATGKRMAVASILAAAYTCE